MSISAFSGPLVVFGQSPIPGQDYNPDLSPSMFYGGVAMLDPRLPFTYLAGEAQSAMDYAWLGTDDITTVNIVPYTKATGAIVAPANPTGPTLSLALTNSTTTGAFVTTSFVRSDTGAVDAGVGGLGLIALDAYTSVTGSIADGVLTVTTNNAMPITTGMVIQTAANVTAGAVAGVSIASQLTGGTGGQGVAGTYQLSGAGTLTSTSGTITLAVPNVAACTVPMGAAGASGIALWNPQSLIGRAVAVTAAVGATSTTATVSGYDIYGYPMVEAIPIVAAAQISGKKAFKYIRSVVLSGGIADTTHTYTVDTTDVFGFPMRSDTFGDLSVNFAASLTALTGITAATSYLPSDRTSPATATTGDPRGTYAAFTSSTGASKMVVHQSPQPYNVNTATGLFGIPHYTNF